jgi:hypothetical protein
MAPPCLGAWRRSGEKTGGGGEKAERRDAEQEGAGKRERGEPWARHYVAAAAALGFSVLISFASWLLAVPLAYRS